jgi:hypothetical protein
MADRPLGVTIIGILWILYGLVLIFGGIIGGAVLSVAGLGALGALIGIVLLIVGIIYLVLGIGSFKAWPWVWIVGVVFTIISVLINLVTLVSGGISAIIGIIIDAIILWYLFQPQVKAYFGTS